MIFATMSGYDWAQLLVFAGVLVFLIRPVGLYMARVYGGQRVFLSPMLLPVERLFHRLGGIDPDQEMSWTEYARAILMFSLTGLLVLFCLLLFQGYLPFNPQNLPGLTPDLAFNAAVSFVTNTNWQSYGGESTLSYLSQMAGMTVQNFVSAACGMAVLMALVRGISRKNTTRLGNFWVDLLRGVLYILLPLALLWALVLGSQGVVQTFQPSVEVPLLEASETLDTQIIPVGPVASQIAIKQLGSNGGGFFRTNSAHPLSNPTPFSNFIEMLGIFLLPLALCYTFGAMLGDERQGRALLIAMTVIFIPLFFSMLFMEQSGNPELRMLEIIDQAATPTQSGGNMEGKEVRFGVVNSALWAAGTTATSNGSVNSMHASYTPLAGMVPLLFIQLGEVVYGGVGSGLSGMVIFTFLTVFIIGLMVGRTPEYMGKKIQAYEIKMACFAFLVPCTLILTGTAIGVLTEAGREGLLNMGAAGFTEVLYAFSSASANNGSAFAGLSANSAFYNIALGLAMLMGRFWVMIPVLAIAGSLAAKNKVQVSAGTLPTHTPLFIGVLVGVILLMGALSYVPALSLGPVATHFDLIGSVNP